MGMRVGMGVDRDVSLMYMGVSDMMGERRVRSRYGMAFVDMVVLGIVGMIPYKRARVVRVIGNVTSAVTELMTDRYGR